MAMDWYYAKDQQPQGPFDEAGFRQLIESRVIGRDTYIMHGGMTGWVRAADSEFASLFGGTPAASGSMPVPQPSSPAAQPTGAYDPSNAPTYQQPPGTNVCAIISLIMGILGVISCYCGGPFALAAVILGHIARGQINRTDPPQQGAGLALAGLITGYIGLAISIIFLALVFGIGGYSAYNGVRTQVTIEAVASSVREYRADVGALPTAIDNAGVMTQLGGSNPTGKDYLPTGADAVATNSSGEVIDSMGNPLHFEFDTDGDGQITVGTGIVYESYAIWSSGFDGINDYGSDDDLTSW